MEVDENDFFRQATMRICGQLKIETAMVKFLQYIQEFMPADRICLELYAPDFSSLRTIAMATPSEGSEYDVLTPLSDEARNYLSRTVLETAPTVLILKNPKSTSLTCEMFKFFNVESNSMLIMTLETGGEPVGGVVLLSEREEEFTEYHAKLLSLLKEPFTVALSNAIEHLEVIKLRDMLADDNQFLHGELRRISGDSIIGADFGLRNAMEMVRKVAQLDSPVLLLGETGAGKDVFANAIHYSSSRRDGPFISVNCGAIPESLIDSELFGHEKGAFTGAISQKRGRFERADKGTILLDEIGELPKQAQVRLLRVLQNKEIERVGGTNIIPLDIRIIAATNRNLEAMVTDNQFREDLWFRLNVFPIWIPPLRQRKTDIPALLQHFISLKAKELKLQAIPNLKPGAVDSLMEYNWPGNVRELQNVVERELILNPKGPLVFEHLALQKVTTRPKNESENLDEMISQHIRNVLAKTNGKVQGKGGAAELLGINSSTLRNRMNKLGIEYKRKR